MLELELLWLEWTAGQESAATMSLVLVGLVLALAFYGFFLTMRLRIFQEIFGSLSLFGPFLFPILATLQNFCSEALEVVATFTQTIEAWYDSKKRHPVQGVPQWLPSY